jgi:hypothetical protein
MQDSRRLAESLNGKIITNYRSIEGMYTRRNKKSLFYCHSIPNTYSTVQTADFPLYWTVSVICEQIRTLNSQFEKIPHGNRKEAEIRDLLFSLSTFAASPINFPKSWVCWRGKST